MFEKGKYDKKVYDEMPDNDKKRIVLFGAGRNGKKLLKRLMDAGIVPSYFVDNNPNSEFVETEKCKIRVRPPCVLLSEDKNKLKIIITPLGSRYGEIELQLDSMGLKEFVCSLVDFEGQAQTPQTERQYTYTNDGMHELLFKIRASKVFVTDEDVAELKKKYIVEGNRRYTIEDYHITFINTINSMFDFEGKRILEVGGSNTPSEIIVEKMKVKNWVSLDTPLWDTEVGNRHFESMKFYDMASFSLEEAMNNDKYFICRGLTDDITSEFHDKFDYVISNACFEHILNLAPALEAMRRCLVKGGVLYSRFGPIWSSRYGSHFGMTFAPPFNKKFLGLYHNNPGFLPYFVHLLHSKKEIYGMLYQHLGYHAKLESWAEHIKHGLAGNLNHYFYEDYEFFLDNTKYSQKVMCPNGTYHVDDSTLKKLKMLYPGYSRFDVHGIVMLAVK